eukprot:95577_1
MSFIMAKHVLCLLLLITNLVLCIPGGIFSCIQREDDSESDNTMMTFTISDEEGFTREYNQTDDPPMPFDYAPYADHDKYLANILTSHQAADSVRQLRSRSEKGQPGGAFGSGQKFRRIPPGSQKTSVYTVERVQSPQYEYDNEESIANVIGNLKPHRKGTFIEHDIPNDNSDNILPPPNPRSFTISDEEGFPREYKESDVPPIPFDYAPYADHDNYLANKSRSHQAAADPRFGCIPPGSQKTGVYTVVRVQSPQYEYENDEYLPNVIGNLKPHRKGTFIEHGIHDDDSDNILPPPIPRFDDAGTVDDAGTATTELTGITDILNELGESESSSESTDRSIIFVESKGSSYIVGTTYDQFDFPVARLTTNNTLRQDVDTLKAYHPRREPSVTFKKTKTSLKDVDNQTPNSLRKQHSVSYKRRFISRRKQQQKLQKRNLKRSVSSRDYSTNPKRSAPSRHFRNFSSEFPHKNRGRAELAKRADINNRHRQKIPKTLPAK